MHTVFALLCFVVVIHWLIFPYPSGLLHWHCGNLTIAPVPAKQPWWIWINTSCEFIMNDYITTTKQSTTKPCAYFLGYTVSAGACDLRFNCQRDVNTKAPRHLQCHLWIRGRTHKLATWHVYVCICVTYMCRYSDVKLVWRHHRSRQTQLFIPYVFMLTTTKPHKSSALMAFCE